jgi:protease-4
MPDDFNPTPRGSFDAPTTPPPTYAAPAYAYVAPPASKRSGWFWVAIIGGIFAVIVLIICVTFASLAKSLGSDSESASGFSTNSIAVIDISGVILDAEKVDKQLRKFGDDDNVKAIILHIDSPGGGAAASQEIYHEVLRIRAEKHKKIIASVESVGASGAYYIASACDKIYANPASVVGSIGVIMEWTNYGELMRWAKLKNITIHAGELKDAGDPTRDLTPKEEAYFQSLVDNMYGQFVHDVATGRHTTDDVIKPLATGQVWTGEQALGLHLIDVQGGFRIALMDTAKDVGISGEPKIVRTTKDKRGIWAALNDDTDTLFPNPSKLLDHAPGFYFMWK